MLDISSTAVQPLHYLETHFLNHCEEIEQWFNAHWQRINPPLYGSVDLRNAGFKIAPIDMNLFPAGFNNLNPNHLPLSIAAAKTALSRLSPSARRVLIIPENHTRNTFYWENVKTLQSIIEQAGYDVRVELLDKMTRQQDELHIDGFVPDLILLNNDLSDGIPELLQNL